jgi:hypothetical protein
MRLCFLACIYLNRTKKLFCWVKEIKKKTKNKKKKKKKDYKIKEETCNVSIESV